MGWASVFPGDIERMFYGALYLGRAGCSREENFCVLSTSDLLVVGRANKVNRGFDDVLCARRVPAGSTVDPRPVSVARTRATVSTRSIAGWVLLGTSEDLFGLRWKERLRAAMVQSGLASSKCPSPYGWAWHGMAWHGVPWLGSLVV
jgi:hypothetical protein